MGIPANIRVNVSVPFPARVVGSGGIQVTKVNGVWTIIPNFAALAALGGIPTPSTTFTWVYDSVAKTFAKIAIDVLIASVANGGNGIAFTQALAGGVADADPGAGNLVFNNAAQNAATSIFADLLDSNGTDVTATLDSMAASTNTVKGQLSIQKVGDSTKRLLFDVTGVTVVAGYRKILVTNRSFTAATPFAIGDKLLLGFVRAGDGAGAGVTAAAIAAGVFGDWTVVASAGTTDIGVINTSFASITGTTTITSFNASPNRLRAVRFGGALTLTHNGASLILPGAANILTAANDTAIFASDASGNWRCLAYTRANGTPLNVNQGTIAAATTTDLGSVLADSMSVTGNTAITSFGTAAAVGTVKKLSFTGTPTISNGANLILPGGANIVVVAGDCLTAKYEGASVWRVTDYQRMGGRNLNSATSETLAAGFDTTGNDLGNINTPLTLNPKTVGTGKSNMQSYTNTGAHTLAPPVALCTMTVDISNGAGAGVITPTGWTKVTGDSLPGSLTAGLKWRCYVSVGAAGSHLAVQQMS